MQRAGYAVEVVDNGEDAFRRASEDPPDLMLLDVMLPRLSGFEVCQRLRALPVCRSLPIVMLTAKGRDGEVSKGLALGATAYVTKPFSVHDLVGQVKRILDSAG
jgi:DNA-binding response OmpR family regulator